MHESTPPTTIKHRSDLSQQRLLWGLLISIALHALVLSLQIGLAGKGMPTLDVPWKKERGAPVPIQVTINAAGHEKQSSSNQSSEKPGALAESATRATTVDKTSPDRSSPRQATKILTPAANSAQNQALNWVPQPTTKPIKAKKKTSSKAKSNATSTSPLLAHRLVKKRTLPPDAPRLLTHSGWNDEEFSVPNPPIDVAKKEEKNDEKSDMDLAASEGIEDAVLLERLKEIQKRKVKSKAALVDAPILSAKTDELERAIAEDLKTTLKEQTQAAIESIDAKRKNDEAALEIERENQLNEHIKQLRERRIRELNKPAMVVATEVKVETTEQEILQAQRKQAQDSERVVQQEEAQAIAQIQSENERRRAQIKSQMTKRSSAHVSEQVATRIDVTTPTIPNFEVSAQSTSGTKSAKIEEISNLPPLGAGKNSTANEGGAAPSGRHEQGVQSTRSGHTGVGAGASAGSSNQDVLSQLRSTETRPNQRDNSRQSDVFRSPLLPKKDETMDMRKRSIVGMEEKEVPLRMYIQSWKLKIERNANLNYSKLARDRARGDPVVTVIIRSDGSVDDIIINRSSGHPEIDEAVRRIIKVNAKYAAFPPNVAAQYEVIEIRKVWQFDEVLRIVDELP